MTDDEISTQFRAALADSQRMSRQAIVAFILESNRIEGIHRSPKPTEIAEFERFMGLGRVTVEDILQFASVYQPDARLRDKVGLNVRVGDHIAPKGGPEVASELALILNDANANRADDNAYRIHCEVETLHALTDCNGRSGRMLWIWMMQTAPLGFLHTWYYQSLSGYRG